jgi:hypothetical protein
VRAYVTFQDRSQPEKEWRCWFTDDDAEDSIERKARNALGIVGNRRRLAYWSDHEGIRLVMTNKRKEIELRNLLDEETEVHEISVCWEESPTSLLTKLGKRDNYFVVDANDKPFAVTDNLFTFATTKGVQPVRIKHGLKMTTLKTRVQLPLKDNREKVEIRFGDEKLEFEKGCLRHIRN